MNSALIFAVFLLVVGIILIILDYKIDDPDHFLLTLGLPCFIVAFLTGVISFTINDVPTQQEKCKAAGFTWQQTDEIIEINDGYEYRHICIDL